MSGSPFLLLGFEWRLPDHSELFKRQKGNKRNLFFLLNDYWATCKWLEGIHKSPSDCKKTENSISSFCIDSDNRFLVQWPASTSLALQVFACKRPFFTWANDSWTMNCESSCDESEKNFKNQQICFSDSNLNTRTTRVHQLMQIAFSTIKNSKTGRNNLV